MNVVRTLTRWYCHPLELGKIVEKCISAARPDASIRIAQALGDMVGLGK
jgi:hypothetical protein